MYFQYGIKNSSLQLHEEPPLELKIPEDRANDSYPPDQMQMQQQQQYMATDSVDPYAQASDGYAYTADPYGQQAGGYGEHTSNAYFAQQPDPLAEDPWSKHH